MNNPTICLGSRLLEESGYANEDRGTAQSPIPIDSDLWLWFSMSDLIIRVESLHAPIFSVILI